MSILINTPCGASLGIKEMNSLRTGSFAQELGKREKKGGGDGERKGKWAFSDDIHTAFTLSSRSLKPNQCCFEILKTSQVITIKLRCFRLRKCCFGVLDVNYKQSGLSKTLTRFWTVNSVKVTVQFEIEGNCQNEIVSHMDRSEVKL